MMAQPNTPKGPDEVKQVEQQSTSVSFRPMVDADIDAVMEIESDARAKPWTRAMFVDEMKRASRRWVVVVAAEPGAVAAGGDRLVGFGGIMVAGDELHVMDIAVHPDFQGREIGRRLLARLLTAGVELGVSAATLEVAADNEPAKGLYRRLGFAAEGRRCDYYGDGVDAIIMWIRDLDEAARRQHLNEMAGVR